MITKEERLKKLRDLLNVRGLFLCTAESCTGGLLGHMITNLPGASNFYLGGQITYSNAAKNNLLGVPADTLDNFGAVSEQTVIAMAQGIRASFSKTADLDRLVGVSISGIAGPSGGSAEKPVGTVWIGVSTHRHTIAHHFQFAGSRSSIKTQSAQQALDILIKELS